MKTLIFLHSPFLLSSLLQSTLPTCTWKRQSILLAAEIPCEIKKCCRWRKPRRNQGWVVSERKNFFFFFYEDVYMEGDYCSLNSSISNHY